MDPVSIPSPGSRHHARWLRLGLAAWALLLLAGFGFAARYEFTPGSAAAAPAKRTLVASKPELMLFLHPQCGCSQATLTELERLLTRTGNRLMPEVFFYAPRSEPVSWVTGDLYRRAKEIPGVDVRLDADGATAKAFGVRTSGQILLYGPDGRLAFSGGITASRGHEGDNPGEDAVVAYIERGVIATHPSPVFGCSLGFATTQGGSREGGSL